MLQQYVIPFSGLNLGKHQFRFNVDDRFLSEFDYSIIKKAKLVIDLQLDKQETMLILDFNITGDINLSCDVCLAGFPYSINQKERQIVKFTNEDLQHDTEDIVIMSRNEHEIDVSKLIYEFINLAVPYISRCTDVGNMQWCDKEMIAKLNDLSDRTKETNSTDPRWEALKNLKKL